jgi:hypothetical protein
MHATRPTHFILFDLRVLRFGTLTVTSKLLLQGYSLLKPELERMDSFIAGRTDKIKGNLVRVFKRRATVLNRSSHETGVWVGPTVGLNAVAKRKIPGPNLNPGSPTCSQSLYSWSYNGSHKGTEKSATVIRF